MDGDENERMAVEARFRALFESFWEERSAKGNAPLGAGGSPSEDGGVARKTGEPVLPARGLKSP